MEASLAKQATLAMHSLRECALFARSVRSDKVTGARHEWSERGPAEYDAPDAGAALLRPRNGASGALLQVPDGDRLKGRRQVRPYLPASRHSSALHEADCAVSVTREAQSSPVQTCGPALMRPSSSKVTGLLCGPDDTRLQQQRWYDVTLPSPQHPMTPAGWRPWLVQVPLPRWRAAPRS